jgi:chromosomal replication initiation ATPase DnaA
VATRPQSDRTKPTEEPLASVEQLVLDFGHTPSHAEDDFIVGDGNRLAHGRIAAFPNWPDPMTLLVGPAKAGKSHLARIFADRSGALLARPSELAAMAAAGGVEPLVIEDVDRAGYEEDALFHLLNQSMRDHRPLLMTAREPIEVWPYRTNDVLSRARRAVAFAVEMTDDIQLSQMFVKLFGDRQVTVDPRIIAYLVARMERSTEEAVALCDLMDRLALTRGTAITRKIAAEALELRRVARGEANEDHPESDTDE